jgi:hypothetical protein
MKMQTVELCGNYVFPGTFEIEPDFLRHPLAASLTRLSHTETEIDFQVHGIADRHGEVING